MQRYYRGLEAALLVVVLFLGMFGLISGCARRQEVYLAGLESELSLQAGEEASEMQMCEAASGLQAGEEASEVQMCEAAPDLLEAQEIESPETQPPYGYVYVCGAVVYPGVYPIYEGMRVFEAIELAGGFAETADEQWLNQAETVADGQRLYVCTKEETAQLKAEGAAAGAVPELFGADGIAERTAGAAGSGSGVSEEPYPLVNLNTADKETLMTLPGIGEAKAEAILSYRETNGGFGSIEEIQNISGIKSAVFSKIKDRITV